jgi:hypothetical protein
LSWAAAAEVTREIAAIENAIGRGHDAALLDQLRDETQDALEKAGAKFRR